jgi:hypothetical protein
VGADDEYDDDDDDDYDDTTDDVRAGQVIQGLSNHEDKFEVVRAMQAQG